MKHEPRHADPIRSAFTYAGLLLIACMGIWGCGTKPTEAATLERARSLETRCVQLEQDYRLVTQARDRARKDLYEAQATVASQVELLKEMEGLRQKLQASLLGQDHFRKLSATRTQERDELRDQLAMRMSERAMLLNKADKLRKGLQSLLQDDGDVSLPTMSE